MPFDPRTFIAISQELQKGNTEAHYRSIIGRAYYGVFGYLRDKLRVYDQGQGAHQTLIDTLLNSTSPELVKIGKRVENLFRARKDSDYKYHTPIKQFNSDFCIKEAVDIIRKYDLDAGKK